MNRNNDLTRMLQINYPVIQAPMLGVSTPEMAAAVSNTGALGSLPVGGLSPDMTLQLIRKTKSLTNYPFAVNLFAHDIPAYNKEDMEAMQQLILRLAGKRGYKLEAAGLTDLQFHTYPAQLDILVAEAVPIISFTFGCLTAAAIHQLKRKGCVLIGTATSVEEALLLQQQQIDMIAVQGIEAGGHRGSFLDNTSLPQVGLFALLPQVKAAVQIPCIAAGGINNARTTRAAFELGADAVQIGTAFIGTKESIAIDAYKQRLTTATGTDSVLTRAFSGRWARGIKNEMMRDIEESGVIIPPYPYQNSLTTKLRKLAQQAGDEAYTNLWAGQSAGKINAVHARDVVMNLIAEYEILYKML